MSYTTFAPAARKLAYQRPYKSRSQRREIDRRKHDEARDHKFLVRIAVAIGFVVLVALGFVAKGMTDANSTVPPTALVR